MADDPEKPQQAPWGDDLNLVPHSWGREGMSIYDCMNRLAKMTPTEKLSLWNKKKGAEKAWRTKRAKEDERRARRFKSAFVVTKAYTRFNPNPKKYTSNAERQQAYRQRQKTLHT